MGRPVWTVEGRALEVENVGTTTDVTFRLTASVVYVWKSIVCVSIWVFQSSLFDFFILAAQCNDPINSEGETDVNCGGVCSLALKCNDAMNCAQSSDCASDWCMLGKCSRE